MLPRPVTVLVPAKEEKSRLVHSSCDCPGTAFGLHQHLFERSALPVDRCPPGGVDWTGGAP